MNNGNNREAASELYSRLLTVRKSLQSGDGFFPMQIRYGHELSRDIALQTYLGLTDDKNTIIIHEPLNHVRPLDNKQTTPLEVIGGIIDIVKFGRLLPLFYSVEREKIVLNGKQELETCNLTWKNKDRSESMIDVASKSFPHSVIATLNHVLESGNFTAELHPSWRT